MVAIYLTGITIAMLNLTGIGFVIFLILFNDHSISKLKKANFKKNNIMKEVVEDKIDRLPVLQEKSPNHSSLSTNKANTRTTIATGIAASAGADAISSNLKVSKTGDSNNIDDILDDLDLSDFDNLDLDDFN
ncbi:MAG: hypothetical protein HQK69_01635 [Desulfamplus sp.]|nr:hypothetical protein [Desulfamplus sp.]